MKKLILLTTLLLPLTAVAEPQTYRVQTRFKNGTLTESYLMASSYEAARQMAQAQCGGPANCSVTVYWAGNDPH